MDPLLESLVAALERSPEDAVLRRHVAWRLLDEGEPALALQHATVLVRQSPADHDALDLLTAVSAALRGDRPPPPGLGRSVTGQAPAASWSGPPPAPPTGYDWEAAEDQVGDIVEPAFMDPPLSDAAGDAYEVERPALRLADVGGMAEVKARLEAAFLLPFRNPELRKAYGKSLRGGLLLYGPPGCGKTFLARALAGELGARLLTVGLHDVLDMYVGNSERNVHAIFELVRRSAPCVLFLDEVDALGQKRSQMRGTAMRGAVNQLLTELDDVHARNEGVFVLAATNHPWDVDSALRRPGRLDRTVFVAPPDAEARIAILRLHLRDRPVAGIDVAKLASQTEGFSGADLAFVCETATERALIDSARTGEVRPIGMGDLEPAVRDVRPSTGGWFDVARNVAEFGNEGGTYDELAAYLRMRKRR